MARVKKQYPEDFKTSFGFSTMTWPVAASTIFISNFFMIYLTDYSGIDSAVGKAGFAAAFGTVLLLVARIIDLIDDPMQAWLIDNSKDGRLGKYRKYAFLNIILVTVAVVCIFSLPAAVKASPVLLCIWVGFFYILYEFGTAFSTSMPLLQKTTYDTKLRTKLTMLMRIWMIVILVPVYFYIPVVTAVDSKVGNIGRSFSLVVTALMIVLGVISFFGVLGLKELPEKPSAQQEVKEKLRFREVIQMFAKNKPLLVHAGAMLLSNLVFGLTSAVSIYFLKWYYCADFATGAVDAIKYAEIYGLFALSGLVPNFIAPFFAGRVIKKAGTYARATGFCLIVTIAAYALMAVAFYTGILQVSPVIFTVINFIAGLAMGTAVIPQTLLWTEGADYAEYQSGKRMSALVNSAANILGKAQTALSTVILGGVLIAAGYSVNNETGNYIGDLARLPKMISSFGFIMTVVPVIVMVLAYLLYKFLYPLTPEKQKEMIDTLAQRRGEAEGVSAE